jgi:protein regulator of cytokinesis 1
MTEEAERLIRTIRQMEAALDDTKPNPNYEPDDGLGVSYPLTRCLKELKEKYSTVSKLHRERFEQVRSTSPLPL